MSTISRSWAILCVAVLCLPGRAPAQAKDDLLDRARDLRNVEAQRVEKEFRDGRNYAYRVVVSDLDKALDRIKDLQAMLDKDQALDAGRRDQLVRTLKRDVSYLQAIAAERHVRSTQALARATQMDLRRDVDPRRTADQKGAFDTARSRMESMGTRVADARTARGQVGDRYLGVLRGIDESAKLPASDYDLPPDWAEKSKKRSPENKLTPREKALLEALKTPITVDFTNETFSSIIEYLQKVTGQTILVDKNALEEANVTYDTPVTLRLNRVSTRTMLKRMLADLGLTYVIKEEAIQITTPARARDMMVTRAYYIGDLIGTGNPFLPPLLNDLQAIGSINTIIGAIQSQVEPGTWQANNGAGSVYYDPIRMTLIIKNSAEIHYMLGGGH
jgi:hypothetical protein